MSRLLAQTNRWRQFKDQAVAVLIRIGGLSIIFVVILIFIYLLYKVLPLVLPADISSPESIEHQHNRQFLYAGVNEYADILFQMHRDGTIEYWYRNTPTQTTEPPLSRQQRLNVDEGIHITAHSFIDFAQNQVIVALSDGTVMKLNHDFEVNYVGDQRISLPKLSEPWGDALLLNTAKPITGIAAGESDYELIIAAVSGGRLQLFEFDKQKNLFGQIAFQPQGVQELMIDHAVDHVLINDDLRWLFVLSNTGDLSAFKLYAEDVNHSRLTFKVTERGEQVTAVNWLLGKQTLLIGTSLGQIKSWFNVRPSGLDSPEKIPSYIRTITAFAGTPVTHLVSLRQSRVILATSADGQLSGFFGTTGDELFKFNHANAIQALTTNNDGSHLFFVDDTGEWFNVQKKDPHPEISLKTLWGKIQYEGYSDAEFIWQSSASSQDFEPKYSLTPLVFGTIKAAFYAMLFAIPLAIWGAIYTAFFIGKRTRRVIKPAIEIMEALPTVILGFLAGLWLAPFVESNLLGVCLAFVLIPSVILVLAYWSAKLPMPVQRMLYFNQVEHRAMALIPWVILVTLVSLFIAEPIQEAFFSGDFRHYLTQQWGIDYNQRNALVVGMVMGFAVIPTIFAITEDAIYSVPKHLVNGSLAMGATLWQTLSRVVLPTASPGIFSAVMIGFGRAVGETMIVLMATGNTPVMSVNIFEGMRTLAANIAVEMPESAIDSSHFRILFLAALVLFLFTFFFNTLAETVRQRLKKRYSEL